MREYWEKFTDTTPTMKEMMLDHDAEKLHRDETREILSCLPDFADRRILELGAGIGYGIHYILTDFTKAP